VDWTRRVYNNQTFSTSIDKYNHSTTLKSGSKLDGSRFKDSQKTIFVIPPLEGDMEPRMSIIDTSDMDMPAEESIL